MKQPIAIYRAWINQPSTSQILHKYHGMKVLVDENYNYHSTAVKIYFLEGTIISMNVPKLTLSNGWKNP
jgi:hypothetical protein